MRAFFTPEQMLHDPQQFMRIGRICPATDLPERSRRLLDVVEESQFLVQEPQDIGSRAALLVHAPHYVSYLETAYEKWIQQEGAGIEVLPNVSTYHNARYEDDERPRSRSQSPVALAGYYLGDMACPVGPHTYHSAIRSTHSAYAAAQAIIDGDYVSYAMCRPSGHHAHRDRAAGFCYFNNAAVAAQHLRSRFGRVATLDVDTHHGDGTQQIFYRRSDILTVSIHADPSNYYPYQTGYADETGYGPGLGFNLNLPMAHGSGDVEMLGLIDSGLEAIKHFKPDALVVSLGFDAHESDPLSVVKVTTDCFGTIGEKIREVEIPVVLVQEGGYAIEAIGGCLREFLKGFNSRLV